MHLGRKTPYVPHTLVKGALFVYQSSRGPIYLDSLHLRVQKEGTCLSEVRVSHSHRTWTEVSSTEPHFVKVGLLLNPVA